MTSEAGPPGVFMPDLISPRRTIGGKVFDFSRQVAVMAIVNRTPDSFYDRGRTFVDIGGVPYGAGFYKPAVSEAEELDRVLPLVEAARRTSDVVISVDTYRPKVAREAIAAGASVINDTSGLHDPMLAEFVADTDACLVITHCLATKPGLQVVRPTYDDVAGEVADFLSQRVQVALARGMRPEQIIIDPGHDLNKNTFHSLELTRRLNEITGLGHPTLVATSNKHFIGETLNLEQGPPRHIGTVATVVVCILQGARIVRVHDVKSAVQATRMTEAILGWRPPAYARHNLA
jgi:dihydropteroate synthase